MKITDDMLTEWRKQFEAEFPMPPDCIWTGKRYAPTQYNAWRAQAYGRMWDGFVAARRTTPDRESIIEECAKVCEMERDALRKNEAIWDANPNLRPDEDYVSEWEASACRGEEYAAAIRALKTAPTSDQGEKS
ncbi:hypothetical protein [Burkholderia multivorans]|uniref:hypothetical protein n=1 Tax=Burkholderia multivorans TaxID=87883 RepID=UPI0020B1AAD4|nr:hypothetical protein [Burkholderia multivorans]